MFINHSIVDEIADVITSLKAASAGCVDIISKL